MQTEKSTANVPIILHKGDHAILTLYSLLNPKIPVFFLLHCTTSLIAGASTESPSLVKMQIAGKI